MNRTAAEALKKIRDLSDRATEAANCGDAAAYRRIVGELYQIEADYIAAYGPLTAA